jgi:hypothetical protein
VQKLVDNCGAVGPSRQILRKRVWKRCSRQLIRPASAKTGQGRVCDRDGRKTFPSLPLPFSHLQLHTRAAPLRSLFPLQPEHSAGPVGIPLLSPSRWLLTSSTRSLVLLQHRQSRHRRAIHLSLHSFLLGPGCSVITPYRQSRRSLRDIQNNHPPSSLFHHQIVCFHITTAFPRAAEHFSSTYTFTSNFTWTQLQRESSARCSPNATFHSGTKDRHHQQSPGRNVESTQSHIPGP